MYPEVKNILIHYRRRPWVLNWIYSINMLINPVACYHNYMTNMIKCECNNECNKMNMFWSMHGHLLIMSFDFCHILITHTNNMYRKFNKKTEVALTDGCLKASFYLKHIRLFVITVDVRHLQTGSNTILFLCVLVRKLTKKIESNKYEFFHLD